MGFSNTEELENAITACTQLINTTEEKSQRKKDLITQLIKLRLKQHELKVTYSLSSFIVTKTSLSWKHQWH